MVYHHLVSLYGVAVALYLDGFIGSISQLTWITEGSTFFVNLRQVMVYHKFDKSYSKLYFLNGIFMALTFGIFRIYFYHYMIFVVLVYHVLYRTASFWSIFYKGKMIQSVAKISMILYIFMYFLQLHWFCKILTGLLNSVGIYNLSPTGPEDESTDDEESADEDEPRKVKKN